MKTGAIFSPCQTYRYELTRVWDGVKPILGGIFLNPSTADAVKDDPTVTRFMVRAKRLGYGGVRLGNLFALRSTDPSKLYSEFEDPVGPENDFHLVQIARACPMVLAGWGVHGELMNRGRYVRNHLQLWTKLMVLGITREGHPRHPLYVSYSTPLMEWI